MIRPLMSSRSVQDLSCNPEVNTSIVEGTLILNGCAVRSDIPFTDDTQRYINARYPREEERGYDAVEELISPGYFAGVITNDFV